MPLLSPPPPEPPPKTSSVEDLEQSLAKATERSDDSRQQLAQYLDDLHAKMFVEDPAGAPSRAAGPGPPAPGGERDPTCEAATETPAHAQTRACACT